MQFKIDHGGLKPSVNHQPLVHGKRGYGSQVVDTVLKRDRGFLQDFINTFPTPGMCAHRPPTRANGLSRALMASKDSPLHCRDVVRSCSRSPRYFFQSILMSAWSTKRLHGKENYSGQPSLEKNQRNSGHICPELPEGRSSEDLCAGSLQLGIGAQSVASSKSCQVTRSSRTLRSFETSNTLTTRSKGWEDIEVDNVKPQEIVSSLPLVTA